MRGTTKPQHERSATLRTKCNLFGGLEVLFHELLDLMCEDLLGGSCRINAVCLETRDGGESDGARWCEGGQKNNVMNE
jgi:hypothetical protein